MSNRDFPGTSNLATGRSQRKCRVAAENIGQKGLGVADSNPQWDIKPEYADIFEIGQLVDLIILDEGNPRTYTSQIQDLDDEAMFVAAPTHKGASVHVGGGSDITVSTLVRGARYMGTATVVSREFIPVEVLRLIRPETVRRVQFRENFRVDVRVSESTLHIQPADDPGVMEELEVEIINLSAGGARFIINRGIPTSRDAPSVKYWLEFPLDFDNPLGEVAHGVPGNVPSNVPGEVHEDEDGEQVGPDIMSMAIRVIGVDEVGSGRTSSILVRSQFINPPMPAQDRITRFVNLCQMVLRRQRFT